MHEAYAVLEKKLRRTLKQQPGHVESTLELSHLLAERGELAEALKLLQRAALMHPQALRVQCALGSLALTAGETEQAMQAFRRASLLQPDSAEIQFYMANTLAAQAAPLEEVLAAYALARAKDPDFQPAYLATAALLRVVRRYAEALEILNAASTRHVPSAELLRNRAITRMALENYRGALADLDAAVSAEPAHPDGHNFRGNALQKLGRFDDALASFQLAQILSPDYASAHWNEALCRLSMGDWSRETWHKYEWGWLLGERHPQRPFVQARWTGEQSLAGKRILLHDEQGLGDTLQFSRFALSVAQLGAEVILHVQPALKSLLQSLPGLAAVIAEGEAIPPFDYHCPLLSLPGALGIHAGNIPVPAEVLAPDQASREKWQARIAGLSPSLPGLRVGIVWSGNAAQGDNHKRSLPLASMLAMRLPGVSFVSLQQQASEAELAMLAQAEVPHFGAELESFADTAALITQMHLVISVCTSVAHLAGAMAAPCWVLLARPHCWRWLNDAETTPWYPSVRLFRQLQPGVWDDVAVAVRAALALQSAPA